MKLRIFSILCIAIIVMCMVACGTKKGWDEKKDNVEISVLPIMLSEYSYEVDFVDDEIEQIKKDYNIEEKESIKKFIYCPVSKGESTSKKEKSKYIIEKITESETTKEIIYSTTLEAPGGKAVIDRELLVSNEFKNKCDEKKLEVSLENAYDMELLEGYKIKKEFDLEVKDGKKVSIKAYEIVKEYSYAVENNDNKIGEGILRKPTGVLLAVCEEDGR